MLVYHPVVTPAGEGRKMASVEAKELGLVGKIFATRPETHAVPQIYGKNQSSRWHVETMIME